MRLKPNTPINQDGNDSSRYLYSPILVRKNIDILDNSSTNCSFKDINGKLRLVEMSEENEEILDEQDVNYPLLLGDGQGTKFGHIQNPIPKCIDSDLCWKMCRFIGCGGLLLIGIIWLLVSSSQFHGTECCNSNWSSKIDFWPFTGNNNIYPSTPSNLDLNSEQVKVLEKIQHKIMSLSLKYIVDFILQSENFNFSCPHNQKNATTRIFPDQLDCQKYYICHENGSFSVGTCRQNQGFDKVSMKCTDHNNVQLCDDIGRIGDFNCTYTGLHPYIGDCNKFILCTREKVAFLANCNPGDFFDPELLICLSSTESEC